MALICRHVLPDSRFVKRPKIFLKQSNHFFGRQPSQPKHCWSPGKSASAQPSAARSTICNLTKIGGFFGQLCTQNFKILTNQSTVAAQADDSQLDNENCLSYRVAENDCS